MDAYKSMYDKKEEVINEMKMGDVSGSADFASRNIKGAKGAATPKEPPKAPIKPSNPVDAKRDRLKKIMADNESVDLLAAYRSIYEHHKKDADGNTIPHEDEEINEGKIPAGLQAYLDKKKGKKEDKKDMKEQYDLVYEHFIGEGFSEEEIFEKMSNLTEEQLDEFMKALATRAAQYGANIGREGSATGFLNQRANKKKVLPVKDQPVKSATDVVKAVSTADKPKPTREKLSPEQKTVRKEITDKMKTQSQLFPIRRKKGQVEQENADLFDIVKGQLLDEGISEEEIKDIMLTLTPDEILNELSVGKMANYISAADRDVQKTADSMRKDSSVMGDDPRIKRMTNRAKGMAMAGEKIAKKMTPPPMN